MVEQVDERKNRVKGLEVLRAIHVNLVCKEGNGGPEACKKAAETLLSFGRSGPSSPQISIVNSKFVKPLKYL